MKQRVENSKFSSQWQSQLEGPNSNFPFSPSPIISFPKQSRQQTINGLILPQVSLGPIYNITSDITQKSSMRFEKYSSRKDLVIMKEIPAPNQYNPEVPRSHSNIVLGKSIRDKINRISRAIPGPGYYQITKQQASVGGLISSSSRAVPQPNKDNPGVGVYNVDSNLTKKSSLQFQFNKNPKHKLTRMSDYSPGPANYSKQDNSFQSNKGQKISTSKRQWEHFRSGGSLLTPGPGSYNFVKQKLPQPKLYQKTIPRQKHESQQIQKLKSLPDLQMLRLDKKDLSFTEQNPYNKAQRQGEIKLNFSKSKRRYEFLDVFGVKQHTQRSPGPANLRSPTRTIGSQFSLSKRCVFNINNTPGVGAYTTNRELGKQYQKIRKVQKKDNYNLHSINSFDDN